jgi:putative transcriptional regulator
MALPRRGRGAPTTPGAALIPGAHSPAAIRALRLALGFTQEDFAHHVGVTVASMNRWEKGTTRPSRLARRALEALALHLP